MNLNLQLIISQVRTSIKMHIDSNRNISETDIRKKINEFTIGHAKLNAVVLSVPEKDEIIRTVCYQIVGTMEDASTIVDIDDFDEWYSDVKADIDYKYWNDYHFHLTQKPFYSTGPNGTLTKLDKNIDFILSKLANPNGPSISRKGMIVGNVQSGKTSHYIGLIAKASDAGYKVVILISGMLEDLRGQTQKRTEEGFLGKNIATSKSVGVGLERLRPSSEMPNCVTTRKKDFTRNLVDSSGYTVESFKETFLIVIKKNASILKNLNQWIEDDLQRIGRKKVDTSLLLIDDEADNASINTKASSNQTRRKRKLNEVEDNRNYEPSRINGEIRQLIKKFEICSYVAYTATPFANIFISPKTSDEMFNEDLFPRHFIQYVNPPNNYFGPSKVFLEKPKQYPNFLKIIPVSEVDGSAKNSLPIKHKKDFELNSLPAKLEESIHSFFISSTIKKLEGFEKDHSSMLVNASTYTLVQLSIKKQIEYYVNNLASLLKYGSKEKIQLLKALWDQDYKDYHHKYKWSDLERIIYKLVYKTDVIVINRSRESEKLEYDEWPSGRILIVVGGFSLSRGLTIEGLITSYYTRNSKMYDTILQMGRWFGYRDGYENLCRLYLTEEAIDDFEHISESVEELSEDIEYMSNQGATPLEFALRVRSDANNKKLKITSRTKMGSGEKRLRSFSYSGKLVQNYVFNKEFLTYNWKLVERFFCEILKNKSIKRFQEQSEYYVFKNIPGKDILKLSEEYNFSDNNSTINKQILIGYLKKRIEFELNEWDIIIDSKVINDKKENINFAGLPLSPVTRKVSCWVGNKDNKIPIDLNEFIYLSRSQRRNICSPDITEKSYSVSDITEAKKIKEITKKSIRTGNLLANLKKRPLMIITLVKPTFDEDYLFDKEDKVKSEEIKTLIDHLPKIASINYLFPRSEIKEELIEVYVNADVDDNYADEYDYDDYYGDD